MEAILQQKPKRGLKSVGGGLDEDEDDTERSYDPVVASAMQELQAKKRAKKGLGRHQSSLSLCVVKSIPCHVK